MLNSLLETHSQTSPKAPSPLGNPVAILKCIPLCQVNEGSLWTGPWPFDFEREIEPISDVVYCTLQAAT